MSEIKVEDAVQALSIQNQKSLATRPLKPTQPSKDLLTDYSITNEFIGIKKPSQVDPNLQNNYLRVTQTSGSVDGTILGGFSKNLIFKLDQSMDFLSQLRLTGEIAIVGTGTTQKLNSATLFNLIRIKFGNEIINELKQQNSLIMHYLTELDYKDYVSYNVEGQCNEANFGTSGSNAGLVAYWSLDLSFLLPALETHLLPISNQILKQAIEIEFNIVSQDRAIDGNATVGGGVQNVYLHQNGYQSQKYVDMYRKMMNTPIGKEPNGNPIYQNINIPFTYIDETYEITNSTTPNILFSFAPRKNIQCIKFASQKVASYTAKSYNFLDDIEEITGDGFYLELHGKRFYPNPLETERGQRNMYTKRVEQGSFPNAEYVYSISFESRYLKNRSGVERKSDYEFWGDIDNSKEPYGRLYIDALTSGSYLFVNVYSKRIMQIMASGLVKVIQE